MLTENWFLPYSKDWDAEILVSCLSLDEKHDVQDSKSKPKSHQAKSAEIRKQARASLAELKGVDPKSISYPRSNIKLEEYNDEIRRLEAKHEHKFQVDLQLRFAKLAKELIKKKNSKLEDSRIITIPQITHDNEEHITSDSNEQIISTKQVKKVSSSIMAIVDISYREDNEGKSAFWDHYTFQRITGYSTRVVGTTDNGTLIKSVIHDKTFGLPISLAAPYKPTPPMIGLHPYAPEDFHGLLLIPGSHSDSDKCPNYQARIKNEKNLIKDAWNRGRPVLGICAGAWAVWDLFGGKEVNVRDHAFRRMPYLTGNGRVGHNTEMHYLRIRPGSILADAMYGKAADNQVIATLPVANSVHNMAMSPDIVPPNMKITARSLLRTDNAPSNKSPEDNVVEAAETCHGAPMLLIQWHPEAFNADNIDGEYHHSILIYMAKAGDTYCRKQAMLLEFKKKYQPKDYKKSDLKGLVKNARKQMKGSGCYCKVVKIPGKKEK